MTGGDPFGRPAFRVTYRYRELAHDDRATDHPSAVTIFARTGGEALTELRRRHWFLAREVTFAEAVPA